MGSCTQKAQTTNAIHKIHQISNSNDSSLNLQQFNSSIHNAHAQIDRQKDKLFFNINEILSDAEGTQIEYKAWQPLPNPTVTDKSPIAQQQYEQVEKPRKVAQIICAFLNTLGGRMYLGISDETRQVKGVRLNAKDRDSLKNKIFCIKQSLVPKPPDDLVKVQFIPVKDENGQQISDLVVVKIIVSQAIPFCAYQTSNGECMLRCDGNNVKAVEQLQKLMHERQTLFNQYGQNMPVIKKFLSEIRSRFDDPEPEHIDIVVSPNQKEPPCKNGVECPYLKRNKCKYYHDTQPENIVIAVSPNQKEPCKNGDECPYFRLNQCKYYHDPKQYSGSVSVSVFVSNLPYSTTSQQLDDFMKEAGDIERITIFQDNLQRSKGHGTVLFANQQGAQNAINKFNDCVFQGRKISVKLDNKNQN